MTDTVTAKLAEWEALVRNAPTGDYGLTYHTGTYEWQIVTDDKPTVQLMRAAITAMPAPLGFVEDVRAMIRDRHRGIGATSDYDIGHRDGWNDALQVIERALTERIGGSDEVSLDRP